MESGEPQPRPANSVGGGLQHERTTLAWERTSIAMMVSGVALAKYVTKDAHPFLSATGVAQIAGGGLLLFWASRNSEMLHNPELPASAVPQVGLTRLIGMTTTLFIGSALVLALILTLTS